MKLESNVKGFVEVIKRKENGFAVKIMTENGEFHEYGNLNSVNVKEFDLVNVGDCIGNIKGELSYSVKVQPRAV